MKDSLIISFIISLFKKILVIYDDCIIEKGIKRICDFFYKKSEKSLICSLFTNDFLNGRSAKNSWVFKIITSPLKFIGKISQKVSDKLLKYKEESEFLKVIENILYIPFREYSYILASFYLGSMVTMIAFKNFTKLNLVYAGFMAFVCLVLFLINHSAFSLFSNSILIKGILSLFNYYGVASKQEHQDFHIKGIKPLCIVFLVVGLLMGFLNPLLLVISIVGAIVVLMMLNSPVFAIGVTVFSSPLLPTMVCAGLCVISVVSFIIKIVLDKDFKFEMTPIGYLIALFTLLCVFSAITSFNITKSIQVLVLYIVFSMMYFVIVNSVKSKNQWYNLIVIFILSGLVVSVIGIFQNFFVTTTQSSWVDTTMFEEIGTRVYATFDNPNVLGQFLVLIAPVTFSVMWSIKKPLQKSMFFVIFALMLLCTVFTWSRASWVGVIFALGFFLVMKDRRWASLCIIALFIMPFVLPENIISRITSIGNLKDSSSAYRLSVWIASLRIAIDYWITGIGLGSGAFERIYQNYALNGAGFALHSHNFYIQLVVEMGVLGLILFLLIILLAYKQIISVKEKSIIKNVLIAIGGALIGYMFQGVAENLWYNYRMVLIFWTYLAILQSGANISKKAIENKEQKG